MNDMINLLITLSSMLRQAVVLPLTSTSCHFPVSSDSGYFYWNVLSIYRSFVEFRDKSKRFCLRLIIIKPVFMFSFILCEMIVQYILLRGGIVVTALTLISLLLCLTFLSPRFDLGCYGPVL